MSDRSWQGYGFEDLSYRVIGACIEVQKQLGPHCMEVDYQRALAIALAERSIEFDREVEISILFDDVTITVRRVDFVIWDDHHTILLETKAKSIIAPEDIEQCLLYLRQGHYRVCLLINFGRVPLEKRRFVHTPQEA